MLDILIHYVNVSDIFINNFDMTRMHSIILFAKWGLDDNIYL